MKKTIQIDAWLEDGSLNETVFATKQIVAVRRELQNDRWHIFVFLHGDSTPYDFKFKTRDSSEIQFQKLIKVMR